MFHYYSESSALAWAAAPFLPPPIIAEPLPWLPFDPDDFERHGPRCYQLDILWQIVEAIEAGHRRILVQLPTGGGKTVLATALLASAERAQFLVHRDELIEQTSKTLWRSQIPHSFVASGKPFDPDAAVLLSGIATLAKRLNAVLAPDIVIVDEAHHAVSNSWSDVIAAFPDAIIIGLTATPQRLDGRGLDAQFDHLILGPPVRWLIDEGYLSDFDYYAPPLGGQDDAAIIGDVLAHWQRLAGGGQGIVFASNREHSRGIVSEFVTAGVRALHVDGTLNPTARREADALFRSGAVTLESNVALFGEGYDIPNIVYCAIARRTQSLSWFLQMVGRALRPVYAPGFDLSTRAGRLAAIAAGPKPRAIICDHGNNWFSHGMPDDPRAWSLAGKLKGSGAGCNDDAAPIHQCLNCYMITPSIVRQCPGCGTEFPVVTRNIRFKEGFLTKIERDERRAQKAEEKAKQSMLRKAEEQACRSEASLIELAKKRGYDNPVGWAKVRLRARAQGKRR
ncbi:DEAD/DEAH box helicase [Sphingomonas hankookensis]|uniref:DEAD/DEAH box helicase n=1 Tax=Sphingomonas hankookensis TaxID=563996 RepID=UPI003D301AFF